jgi:hypothetical protein
VAPGLLFEALFEIFDEFFRGELLQRRFVHAQGIGHLLGVLQPLLEQGAGHFVDGQAFIVRQGGPFEMMGEHLVVEVEVAFAFDQDGARDGVKVFQAGDQAPGRALCARSKRPWAIPARRGL